MPKRKRVSGSAPLAPVNTTNEDEISPAHDSRRRSTREKHGVDRYKAEPSKLFYQPRFEFVPSNGWHPLVRQLNCKARNTLPWGLASDTARDGRGRIEVDESSLPEAPCPCWLLPVRDEIAEHVARLAPQLRAKGWKLLTCDVETIARLSNKGTLAEYAAKLGLSDHLPRHWNSPEKAVYPCLLKAAIGEHGQDIFIVKSAEEVHEHAPGGGFGSKWLLQELIPGRHEVSTSLLVQDGKILDTICTVYEYSKEVYVWPDVSEVGRSWDMAEHAWACTPAHLAVMSKFLAGCARLFRNSLRAQFSSARAIFGALLLSSSPPSLQVHGRVQLQLQGAAGQRPHGHLRGEHARRRRPGVRRAARARQGLLREAR